MKIDTLIISGGSTKGISILGSLYFLKKSDKLKNLKHIITLSVGSIMILPLILNININAYFKICCEIKNIIDYDSFDLNNLFDNYGFFDHKIIENILKKIFIYIFNKDNITLKELYDYSKIKLTIKVTNLSKSKVEYFNYKNNPNIDYITLVKMTTCIPVVFEPIVYKNNLYIDGGLTGCMPLEYNKSKNYFGINICDDRDTDVNNFFNYFKKILYIYTFSEYLCKIKKNKKVLTILLKKSMFNLKIDDDENKSFFYEGYIKTLEYFSHC